MVYALIKYMKKPKSYSLTQNSDKGLSSSELKPVQLSNLELN